MKVFTLRSYFKKIFFTISTINFLLFYSNLLLAAPVITYFQDKISEENQEMVLKFNNVISQAFTEITGIDPQFSFEFYCDRLPTLTWSHDRSFWNTGDCSDYWFNHYFYQQYSHEIAQLFFIHNIPSINDDIDNGIYDQYFSPEYVLNPDEHISFALDTIFWNYFAEKYGIDKKLGGSLPIYGFKIALDSEFYKILKEFNPATIHHTEIDYQNFLNFSFYVGQMLFVKLYIFDKNFFRDFIEFQNDNPTFQTLQDYAEQIIQSFKRSDKNYVDGIPIEDFVWGHPDFRRFIEDYTKRYYFDIALVDYNKTISDPPFFFFNLTKINPTNFCFIATSFKNYSIDSGVFNQETDDSINNLIVNYKIINNNNIIVQEGTSTLLTNEYEYCRNVIPENLPEGKYTIEANINIDNQTLIDKIDFIIKRQNNFYIDDLEGYNYLVLRNIRLGSKCYYIKMGLYDNLLKLDEFNEVQCNSNANDLRINNDGSIYLKNIYYKNAIFDLNLRYAYDYYYTFDLINFR